MLIQTRNVNRRNELDDGGKRMEEASATRERFSRARERNEEREERGKGRGRGEKIKGERGEVGENARISVRLLSRPIDGAEEVRRYSVVAHGGPPPILAYRLITEKTAGIPGTPRDMYRAFSRAEPPPPQSAITHRSRRARVSPARWYETTI